MFASYIITGSNQLVEDPDGSSGCSNSSLFFLRRSLSREWYESRKPENHRTANLAKALTEFYCWKTKVFASARCLIRPFMSHPQSTHSSVIGTGESRSMNSFLLKMMTWGRDDHHLRSRKRKFSFSFVYSTLISVRTQKTARTTKVVLVFCCC